MSSDLATLLDRVSALLGRRDLTQLEFSDWFAGPADGGPGGDGLYPMTDSAGVVHLLPSLAKVQATGGGGGTGGAVGSLVTITPLANTEVDATVSSCLVVNVTRDWAFSFAPIAPEFLDSHVSFTLYLVQGGAGGWDIRWPGNLFFADGAPLQKTGAGAVLVLTVSTYDNGLTWSAAVLADILPNPSAAKWFTTGVTLLPGSSEFLYDPIPVIGQRADATTPENINSHRASTPETDYTCSLEDLRRDAPSCKTVGLVVTWFGTSLDAGTCKVHPATTYPAGTFMKEAPDGTYIETDWRVSGYTQDTPGVPVPPKDAADQYYFGGTQSDASLVRAMRAARAKGFRVVFYPFIQMENAGFPWRGDITHATDKAAATTDAVASFIGTAQASQFTKDKVNLTVNYSGPLDDHSYRRMILHYAHLCAMAGGVDLFIIGSEFRGLERLRGPAWTPTGNVANGMAAWDYPFVNAMIDLAAAVRGIFDAAGLKRDLTQRKNLITYAADWSSYMGQQHDGLGHWPCLDQLWGSAAIDAVGVDNYAPLSDWTSAPTGGTDGIAANWTGAKSTVWPVPVADMNKLGLTGTPALLDINYLKANIEGGEKYAWQYYDSWQYQGISTVSGKQVSRPGGDREAQDRKQYYANQQLMAPKMVRWFWNNQHKAIRDSGNGQGWTVHPEDSPTCWVPRSKPFIYTEYGFPSVDRATNQPNAFYDPKSSQSMTPFWSEWTTVNGQPRPVQDVSLQRLALRAFNEYWRDHNERSVTGVRMVDLTLSQAWTWDVRPYPEFPAQSTQWGDTGSHPYGHWLTGKLAVTQPA